MTFQHPDPDEVVRMRTLSSLYQIRQRLDQIELDVSAIRATQRVQAREIFAPRERFANWIAIAVAGVIGFVIGRRGK